MSRNLLGRKAAIAVDLGAESCRVSLLRWVDGAPSLSMVHRFANGPIRVGDGSLRWSLETILEGVEEGMRRAGQLAPEGVGSIAVDGWAVDYVRLGAAGQVIEDPFCYRDDRNDASAQVLHGRIAPARMREITGIEQQSLNTVYQLFADKLKGHGPTRWLNLPEYLLYRWGGQPVAEETNASHTQLIDLAGRGWSEEVFEAAGLDVRCAARIVPPGTVVGKLVGPLAGYAGLEDALLIAPACHDTASAIAGIAEADEDWAYISCGTWSLVGTLVSAPLNSSDVRDDNFTNLAAVGGRTCFHKSVNGMWLVRQCMDHWAEDGEPWNLVELLAEVDLQEARLDLLDLLDVDDPALVAIGDMPSRINRQRVGSGLKPLSEESKDAPAMICLLLRSLAERYAEVLERIQIHTQKKLSRIVMVGGGSQNATLRRFTAERSGLPVIRGPSESSTIGNFAIQCAVLHGSSHRERTGVPAAALKMAGAEEMAPAEFAREVTSWAKRVGAASWSVC